MNFNKINSIMNYNKIGIWMKGYLDAIQNGDEVTKGQLEFLISRVQEMISDLEQENSPKESIKEDIVRNVEEDDLPF